MAAEDCYSWDSRINFIVRYMYGELKQQFKFDVKKSKFSYSWNVINRHEHWNDISSDTLT